MTDTNLSINNKMIRVLQGPATKLVTGLAKLLTTSYRSRNVVTILFGGYLVYKLRSSFSNPLNKKILSLFCKRRLLEFLPRSITKPGSHYATKIGSNCGFMRVSGFRQCFEPTIDVYQPTVELVNVLGVSLQCSISVERIDLDYVEVRAGTPFFTLEKCNNNLNFVANSGEVAALGYLDGEGEARVQVQAAPFVGCDIALNDFEELRFRTGNKPNMGYMEFISRNMAVEPRDVPRIAQALKEELRVFRFEPLVVPIVCGGDGDVEVVLLCEENDVDLSRTKPLGKILPQPYDRESVVFAVTKSSEKITFEDRIEKYVKRDSTQFPRELIPYKNDFLQWMFPIGVRHGGALDDLETMVERQKRASQKLGYDDMKDLPDPLHTMPDSSFQKGEVYPEIKAPRNIINPSHSKRVLTSSMIAPFSEYIKNGPLNQIYGFGDSEYVMSCFEKVQTQDTCIGKFETDGTKMDANIHKAFRDLELDALLLFFNEDIHDLIREIHSAQYEDMIPKSKKGNKVKLYWSRRSGEGGTSIFNTLAMTFVFYVWLRTLGHSHKDTIKKLGVYGGDDGLTVAWGDEDSLLKVSDQMGLPLKVKRVETSEPFSFLGITKMPACNLYVPDVIRFCSKIAYSHVKGVPVAQVLYRKCEPYVRMYPNVPLVGNLCRSVLRILRNSGFQVEKRYDELCRSGAGYVMSMLEGSQLPGPVTDEEYRIVECYVVRSLGISLGDLRAVCGMYDQAEEFKEFPTGYISSENMFLNAPYEALLRDIYIPCPPQSKLDNPLPVESLLDTAAQNYSQNYNEDANKTKHTKTSGPSESSSPTIESDSVGASEIKSPSSAQSRKKRKARKLDSRRDAVSEDSASTR